MPENTIKSISITHCATKFIRATKVWYAYHLCGNSANNVLSCKSASRFGLLSIMVFTNVIRLLALVDYSHRKPRARIS